MKIILSTESRYSTMSPQVESSRSNGCVREPNSSDLARGLCADDRRVRGALNGDCTPSDCRRKVSPKPRDNCGCRARRLPVCAARCSWRRTAMKVLGAV
jgi:hypothetical protein